MTGKELENTKREKNQENEKGHQSWKETGEPQRRIVSYNPLTLSDGPLDNILHPLKERANGFLMQGTTTKDWTDEGRPMSWAWKMLRILERTVELESQISGNQ